VLILENQSPRNQEGDESMGAEPGANSCVQPSLWFNAFHSFWCIHSDASAVLTILNRLLCKEVTFIYTRVLSFVYELCVAYSLHPSFSKMILFKAVREKRTTLFLGGSLLI
jgi:hypothetical protein